jgi:hypothetical protein
MQREPTTQQLYLLHTGSKENGVYEWITGTMSHVSGSTHFCELQISKTFNQVICHDRQTLATEYS